MSTALQSIVSLGAYATLIGEVSLITLKRPPSWNLIREQLFHIGVMSFGVIAITGFSTGLVLSTQFIFQLQDKGMVSISGLMVGKAMITELGPVLTAFMVTGRVGAAMCAELGTMKVTEQIDALRSMAINPHRYLISPRFIAGLIMVPLLTIFSVIMGIFGAYLLAVYFFHILPSTFLDPIHENITNLDLFMCISKSIIFGILIVTISAYKGLKTKGGAEGVGRATTSSVVICYTSILIVNFLLTLGINTYGHYFSLGV